MYYWIGEKMEFEHHEIAKSQEEIDLEKIRFADISYFFREAPKLTDLHKMAMDCESYNVLVNKNGEICQMIYVHKEHFIPRYLLNQKR